MSTSNNYVYERRYHRGKPQDLALVLALLGLALVAGLIIFIGSRQNTEAALPRDAQLYVQHCAACHGPDGRGNESLGAPDLTAAGQTWLLTDGQIQRSIQAGSGHIMPSFGGQLNNDDVELVIRYMQSWWTPEQLAAQQEHSQNDPIK